jgi:hypothetical protein
MTLGRGALVAAGLVGAFGLGFFIRPHVGSPLLVVADEGTPRIGATGRAPVPKPTDHVLVPAGRPATRETRLAPVHASVPASEPELQRRLKPLLNKGANMKVAADGFRSAEQFASVAHASQNLHVPFMLLKHRVLVEGDTLAAAIRKSKPDVNAVAEVERAQAEARSDISAIN